MNFSVSIVIPAYNCEKTISQTLRAIKDQSCTCTVEVIVVDDGSTDQSSEVIQSFQNVNYIFQENAGPATARNRGARESKGDFIFFTDSDCIPQKNWIEKTLSGFLSDDVAAVAGSYGIANSENRLARCIHAEILFRHQTLMPEYVKALGSYNFCIRKKVFEEVGGFEESYPHASGEDNDLSYKIINAGFKIYFQKDSYVDHYHPTKIKKYMFEQFRHGYWRVKMYADHPHMAKGDDYTFWKDILEVPLAGLIFLSFFGSLFQVPRMSDVFVLLVAILGVIQIIFTLKFCRELSEVFLMTFVLFERSLFRFLGFTSGICNFLLKKIIK